MFVPILFSVPLQGCYQAGALCAGHCRVVQSECLLAVQHKIGHFAKIVSHNPYNHERCQGV